MKRVVFGIGMVVIFLIPISIVAYRNKDAIQDAVRITKFLSQSSNSPRYIAETKTPAARIVIVDTAFLEYIAETLHIYDVNAIADPEVYFGNRASVKRHTVQFLKFELVPTLDRYLVALGGSTDFAGRGTYTVEDTDPRYPGVA